jgi:hypothetical protein
MHVCTFKRLDTIVRGGYPTRYRVVLATRGGVMTKEEILFETEDIACDRELVIAVLRAPLTATPA